MMPIGIDPEKLQELIDFVHAQDTVSRGLLFGMVSAALMDESGASLEDLKNMLDMSVMMWRSLGFT